jgi:hypothetical protein
MMMRKKKGGKAKKKSKFPDHSGDGKITKKDILMAKGIIPKTKKKEGRKIMAKRGLYANIHAKKKRIAAGSGEKMRKPGAKGAPTAANFKRAAKTAKKKPKKKK